jgi:hypothetical protein
MQEQKVKKSEGKATFLNARPIPVTLRPKPATLAPVAAI